MKNPAKSPADRMIRTAATLVCVALVDANIILLSLPVIRFFLTQAGVSPLEAVFTTLDSLFVTVPVVLGATALIFGAMGWRKLGRNQQSLARAPRPVENRPSNLAAGIC